MTATALEFPQAFDALVARRLTAEATEACFGSIFSGSWTPVQIGAFLAALRAIGETAEVIAAAARAMRSVMQRVPHDKPMLLDTCGTGGDGSNSLNLSTAAAILCAGLGIPVAKHGNRGISSRSGSADVLVSLGVAIEQNATSAVRVLDEANIVFLMAPLFHPAMRYAGPVRKELGVRTLFNCLGPIVNPASATHQLLGAYSDEVRPVLAHALNELGTQRAWVVRGVDGMDEISPFGPTRVSCIDQGQYSEFEVSPETFGLPVSPKGAVAGGSADENAAHILQILRGEPHPARNGVVLNAAAAVVVARNQSPVEACRDVLAALDAGLGLKALESFRAASQRFAKASVATATTVNPTVPA